ncbi:MAG: aminotransferase class I/II-fold pyridoxal phosphate-dependent enzyme [Gemmatimonadota bacterium]|nr:aminotransferase class I/II-fold pyridoxal phosphate-dependent enzyme [Gemmatimonadota bacterium]
MTTNGTASAAFSRSKNLAKVEPTGLRTLRQEVERRRAAGDDVVDLARDESTHEPSRALLDLTVKPMQQAPLISADAAGTLALRAAAARYFSLLSGGRPVNADYLVVTSGARHAVFSACLVLFESGDHVLVPAPSAAWFPSIVRLARATPVPVPGDVEWSLKVSVADLEQRTDARTVGLILSSPVNPTGAVYTRSELKSIVTWARDRGLWLIVDESYRQLHFGSGPAPSVLDLQDELLERVVVVAGLGLSPGTSGWRVGVAMAPSAVAQAIALLQEHTTGGASVPAQEAAAVLLTDARAGPERELAVDAVRLKRDRAVQFFREKLPGIEFVEPLGGLSLFFRVDGFFTGEIDGARAFCEQLLTDRGVALAPGDAFGDGRWIRLTYGVPDAELETGLERLADFAGVLTKGGTP